MAYSAYLIFIERQRQTSDIEEEKRPLETSVGAEMPGVLATRTWRLCGGATRKKMPNRTNAVSRNIDFHSDLRKQAERFRSSRIARAWSARSHLMARTLQLVVTCA